MKNNSESAKFGTFGGVFTPCTLTILGVIMFLRFGEVVGQSGLINVLLIVILSKVITTLTTLSLSAIATNTKVKGGGAYYLISRSLGVEFGGAIGVVFYLAQAISVSMYVIGFTEAFVGSFINYSEHFIEVATVINILCFICVYIGASWTIKIQYFILAVLALSIISFSFGAISSYDVEILRTNISSNFSLGSGFFTMFALFFPAVTGIMAGANMSGDLANPAKSIPRGTLAAVLVTGLVYLAQAVLLAGSRPSDELISNNFIIKDISFWPLLIILGVFSATLSSALSSMMGAPRILQAFAKDNVLDFLKFFAPGSGSNNEPRRATVLTFIIAQFFIIIGDLNAIAPVITLFFMITYGLINLATFYEVITKNPSYRPTFKYCHWSMSLLGALSCFAVMFLINWFWALISLVIIFALHRYISFKGVEARWGDLRSGIVYEKARLSLIKLQDLSYHPKNWRPNILALTGVGWSRPYIPIFGQWLTAGHGILTLAQVVKGSIDDHVERLPAYEKTIRKFIEKEGLFAFPAVTVAQDLTSGISNLLQCHGIGGFKANTLLTGWPNEEERIVDFFSILRSARSLNKSIVAIKIFDGNSVGENQNEIDELSENFDGYIDVWWRGLKNGTLMLVLAHLLQQNTQWRSCKIRIIRVIDNEEGKDEVLKHLKQLANDARIRVIPKVIVSENTAATIKEVSADSTAVFFGLELPEHGEEKRFYSKIEELAKGLQRIIFVHSIGDVELET